MGYAMLGSRGLALDLVRMKVVRSAHRAPQRKVNALVAGRVDVLAQNNAAQDRQTLLRSAHNDAAGSDSLPAHRATSAANVRSNKSSWSGVDFC
jgi:hypothetical protein